MAERPLSPDELRLWREFRFMVEETSLRVSRELAAETGVSGGEFGILTNLAEAPGLVLRQQELADAMRWDRTRLSHQLTRMAARNLVRRRKQDDGATMVLLTEQGEKERSRVAPVLAGAVRRSFLQRLNDEQMGQLETIISALRND